MIFTEERTQSDEPTIGEILGRALILGASVQHAIATLDDRAVVLLKDGPAALDGATLDVAVVIAALCLAIGQGSAKHGEVPNAKLIAALLARATTAALTTPNSEE